MCKYIFSFLFFFSVFFAAAGAGNAQDAPMPLLIEMFGTSVCSLDTAVQEDVRNIVESNPDIIFLNCRTQIMNNSVRNDPFSRQFCDEKRKAYHREMASFNIKNPQIIINARYDAYQENIMAAVRAARSLDAIGRINLAVDEGHLKIEIPPVKSDHETGQVLLYAYQPVVVEISAGQNAVRDRARSLEAPVDGDLSAPLVENPDQLLPLHFRPVVAMTHVGEWQGMPASFSVSLEDIDLQAQDRDTPLGYVAILHEKNDFGPVLAVGEIKAADRYNVPVPDIYTQEIEAEPAVTN